MTRSPHHFLMLLRLLTKKQYGNKMFKFMTAEGFKDKGTIVLNEGQVLYRGPLIDSGFITITKGIEAEIVGIDEFNELQIVGIVNPKTDKVENFYIPMPPRKDQSS